MTGMAGVGGIGGGGGLPVGGATAIMASMPAPAAVAGGNGAASGVAETVRAGAASPLMRLAEKLDDIMTAALLLELMDRNKKDEGGNGMTDALVAAAALSLYKGMQSLGSTGASASVAGVTISITA